MKKPIRIELPLLEPIYSTYHNQGVATAILSANPSIRNWYMNHVMILTCSRKFLTGFSSPEINIADSGWIANPYYNKTGFAMKYLNRYVHDVIRNLLTDGYYVCFSNIDDFYIKGKSWYKKRHFIHDGCICGYDQRRKTYCMYAYDENWIYRKFWTPQKFFEQSRQAQFKKGMYGNLHALKPKDDLISFSATAAIEKIREYLNSTMDQYPESGEGTVAGIVVHDYIAKYTDLLFKGAIPYERIDRRVFRMIWEHKKAMYQRITLIEQDLSLDLTIGEKYQTIVKEAEDCRMLYAAHLLKRRDSLLPVIRKKLLTLKSLEKDLLEELLKKVREKKEEK